jgi:DNA-directed RNA polymerase subunit RPC12/RpoP
MSRQYDYYKGGFPKGTICLWVEAGEYWCADCLKRFCMLDTWAEIERFRPIEEGDHFDEYPRCVSCGHEFDYILLTPEWERNELLKAIREQIEWDYILRQEGPPSLAPVYRRFKHYIVTTGQPEAAAAL